MSAWIFKLFSRLQGLRKFWTCLEIWLSTNPETHISHGIQSPRLPVRTGLIQMKSVVFMAAQSAIKRPRGTNSPKRLCLRQRVNRANQWKRLSSTMSAATLISRSSYISATAGRFFSHWGRPSPPVLSDINPAAFQPCFPFGLSVSGTTCHGSLMEPVS